MMDGNEPLRGDELLRKVGEDDGWIKRLERTPFERDLDGFTIWAPMPLIACPLKR